MAFQSGKIGKAGRCGVAGKVVPDAGQRGGRDEGADVVQDQPVDGRVAGRGEQDPTDPSQRGADPGHVSPDRRQQMPQCHRVMLGLVKHRVGQPV